MISDEDLDVLRALIVGRTLEPAELLPAGAWEELVKVLGFRTAATVVRCAEVRRARDCTWREAAEIVGVSHRTLKSALVRARAA